MANFTVTLSKLFSQLSWTRAGLSMLYNIYLHIGLVHPVSDLAPHLQVKTQALETNSKLWLLPKNLVLDHLDQAFLRISLSDLGISSVHRLARVCTYLHMLSLLCVCPPQTVDRDCHVYMLWEPVSRRFVKQTQCPGDIFKMVTICCLAFQLFTYTSLFFSNIVRVLPFGKLSSSGMIATEYPVCILHIKLRGLYQTLLK